MSGEAPPRVTDVTEHWVNEPDVVSERCLWWVDRIRKGFTRNRRLSQFGYYEASEFYGVHIWEYLNILQPKFWGVEASTQEKERGDKDQD
jgi:hypothetical protein